MTGFRAQEGAQILFLSSPADIAVYGGSAGSGKTFSTLLESARHCDNGHFNCVIFRREFKQIVSNGGIRDAALKMYPDMGATYRSQPTPHFIFPSGANISFSHLNTETETLAWQGAEICLICFDELTHFTKYQFEYLMSRNRSTCGVRPYIRATTNPDSDSWVADYLSWWIDQDTGYPIKERSGKLRYMTRIDGEQVWGDTKSEMVKKYGCDRQDLKSVTFISAKITDNPILLKNDPGYLSNLKALSRVERARLLEGNWKIRPVAGMYFPRSDAVIIDWKPEDSQIVKWVRSWDLAASEETEGRDPDWTVGMLVGRRTNGKIVIADVIRVRRKAADVRSLVRNMAVKDGKEVWAIIPKDPGQAGKEQSESYRQMLNGFNVISRSITKNKLAMAEPAAALWQQGNIECVRAKWNEELLKELESFPEGKHDDLVDALSSAVSNLPGHAKPNYTQTGLSGRFKPVSMQRKR